MKTEEPCGMRVTESKMFRTYSPDRRIERQRCRETFEITRINLKLVDNVPTTVTNAFWHSSETPPFARMTKFCLYDSNTFLLVY